MPISLRALDAFELSDVVTPDRAEWALLWEARSDVTGQCAKDAGSTPEVLTRTFGVRSLRLSI